MDFKTDFLGNKIEQGSVVIAIDDTRRTIGICTGFTDQKVRILINSSRPYIHNAWDCHCLRVIDDQLTNYFHKGELEKLKIAAVDFIAKDKPRAGVKKEKSDIKI